MNMDIKKKLNDLKIVLPEPKDPVGAYVATKIVGKLLFISGGSLGFVKDNISS